MQKRQRFILVVLAVVIFLWFNVATYWWVSSFGSVVTAISRTWQATVNNWMIAIIFTDSLLFLLLIFVWLLDDARQRGWTGFKRWGWIAALLGLGSPALLVYLVLRPKEVFQHHTLIQVRGSESSLRLKRGRPAGEHGAKAGSRFM